MTDSPTKRTNIVAAFKESKVGTCREVAIQRGHNVAIPFYNINIPQEQPKLTERRSVSHDVHMIRNNLHAGMVKKPLLPYQPLAERSRLRSSDFVPPYKNSSSVVIGDRNSKDRRQFLTMAQNMLKKPKIPLTTNQGILSEHNRWKKYKQWL